MQPIRLAHAILTVVSLISMVRAAAATPSFSLSPACTNTLLQIGTSPDAACLNPMGILSVGNSLRRDPVIPVSLLDNWVKGFCTAPKCSGKSLATVTQAILEGCKTEPTAQLLSPTGLDAKTKASLVSAVQKNYPLARSVLCMQDTKQNPSQVCLTQTLLGLQSTFGKFGVSDIFGIFLNLGANPSKVVCTDCLKATGQMIAGPAAALNNGVFSQCPKSFADGKKPVNIVPL
ncbi:hypothetical protein C8J56DRAFT_1169133 [Mycena floridula]|nr:hypothetical protein C8J56DRAFT_1169133 [Mycena floridula]